MTGHLMNNIDEINKVLWPDAELESLTVDYDSVKMRIEESNGFSKVVTCHGYIGFEGIGLWDEIVIETASIHHDHELIHRSLTSISNRHGENIIDSGSSARNLRDWSLLSIKFIDDSEVNVVMSRVSVEVIDKL